MPRVYKRKLGSQIYCNYDENKLADAVKAIKSGKMSYRKAQEYFRIPRSTLENKVNRTNPKSIGTPSVLNKEEEKMLVHGILRAAHWGYPLDSTDIRGIVKGYLDRAGRKEKRFTNNLPGYEWTSSFLKRHADILSVRLSENIKRARAEVNINCVKEFFENLRESLEGIPPENVINYDETNFSDDPGRKHVVVKRGIKHAERVMDSSKASISVMMCASGDGKLLPTYVLYKAEHLWDTWQEGGPPDARYNRNKSGWFDLPIYEDWFLTVALPYLKKLNGVKIMIGDNLSSHISLAVVKECENHDISFILLPPNSTHILQPLDVSFFGPLKKAWRDVLTNWKMNTRGPICRDAFPALLKETLQKIEARKVENIKSGFHATGLIPFDPQRVLKKIPQSSELDESSASWSASFETVLSQARYGTGTDTRTIRRRRKLDVPPGKSIVGAHFADEVATENGQVMSKTSSQEDVSVLTATPCLDLETFVVVNYNYDSGNRTLSRNYVGVVVDMGAKDVVVKFLRAHDGSKRMFVFPNIEDEDTIPKEQITEILSKSIEKRGIFVFDKDIL